MDHSQNSPSNELRGLDFLIIGAQKASSTWVHQALRKHPRVHLGSGEERVFENGFYDAAGLRRLTEFTRSAPMKAKVGIRCPDYLARPECPARIAEHAPNAQLIVVLRDPVERAISAYYHMVRSGVVPFVDPNEALDSLLCGTFHHPHALTILAYGRYGEAIRRYQQHFRRDQLLILLDSGIRTDRSSMYGRLCAHIGVEIVPPAWLNSIPRNQGMYSLPLLRLSNAVNRRWIPEESQRRAHRGFLGVRSQLSASFARLLQRVSSLSRWMGSGSSPIVSTDVRQRLRDYYRSDLMEAEVLTGLDLSAWRT